MTEGWTTPRRPVSRTTPTEAISGLCDRVDATSVTAQGSARRDCLDHLLIFGRRHLEKVLAEFIDHYNQARPHQGLDQRVPCPPTDTIVILGGSVERRDRLGQVRHPADCSPSTNTPGPSNELRPVYPHQST